MGISMSILCKNRPTRRSFLFQNMLHAADLTCVEADFDASGVVGFVSEEVLHKSLCELSGSLIGFLHDRDVKAGFDIASFGVWHRVMRA